MVRVISTQIVEAGKEVCFGFAGLSTDEKPIREDMATGSSFLEVDTGNVFFFDEVSDGGKWWQAGGSLVSSSVQEHATLA